MNIRYGKQEGWELSSRFAAALRWLAEKRDNQRNNKKAGRMEKYQYSRFLIRAIFFWCHFKTASIVASILSFDQP